MRRAFASVLAAAVALVSSAADAHLMAPGQGTLNVVDREVFTALSVPAAAFPAADDDGDGELSIAELTRHHEELTAAIARRLTVLDGEVAARTMRVDLMLSPEHDRGTDHAPEILVLHHAAFDTPPRALRLRCDLTSPARSLSITATRHPASGVETEVGVVDRDTPERAFFALGNPTGVPQTPPAVSSPPPSRAPFGLIVLAAVGVVSAAAARGRGATSAARSRRSPGTSRV